MENLFKENLQTNYKEMQDRKTQLASKPIKLNVVLTTRCNLHCLMCEVRNTPWQIPKAVITEITFLFPYLQEIVWQGGEVFLLDWFRGLLEEASLYPDLTHEITTNGHLIDEEWMEILSKVNLNLNISIDGMTKDIYEQIRKGGKFEDLIRALNLINEIKDKGTGRGLVLVLIMTVMRSNYRGIERVVEFARQYNFDRIVLQPVKGNFYNRENIFFDSEERILWYIGGVMPVIKKQAKEAGIKLVEWLPALSRPPGQNSHDKKEMGQRLLCYAPWQQMFIEWGGAVYPHCLCIEDGPNESRKIGNVLRETLAEIWNGERIQYFRKKIIDGDLSDHLCNRDCLNGLISADARDTHLKL